MLKHRTSVFFEILTELLKYTHNDPPCFILFTSRDQSDRSRRQLFQGFRQPRSQDVIKTLETRLGFRHTKYAENLGTRMLPPSAKSRNRARGPSVEGNKSSGIIQTGSQKSWLIFTAHVLQTFDTLRYKLANIKRYSVGIGLLMKKYQFQALNSYEILPMENITPRTDGK